MLRLPRLRLRPAPAISPVSSCHPTDQDSRRRRHVIDDAGATGIEYALLACFVALAISVGATLAGNGLNKMFYVIGDKMMNATNAATTSN